MGMRVLVKAPPPTSEVPCPLPDMRTQREGTSDQPGSESALDTESARPDPELPASELWEINFRFL